MVKLSDYSLVQSRLFSILDSKGITDQVTPMYVSPELIRKEKATPKSDIYSLGITMYYMFTEQLPFMVDTLQRLYNCHLRVMPEHPSNVNRKCPRALGDIIMKMIQKDPAKRFYSCDELRIKLAEIGKSRI
jgi:eukaryotic-like serine/threonine-protein kinase